MTPEEQVPRGEPNVIIPLSPFQQAESKLAIALGALSMARELHADRLAPRSRVRDAERAVVAAAETWLYHSIGSPEMEAWRAAFSASEPEAEWAA